MYSENLLIILLSAIPATGPATADLMSCSHLRCKNYDHLETSKQCKGMVAQRTKTRITQESVEAQSSWNSFQELLDREARIRAVQSVYRRADIAKSTPYAIVVALTRIQMAHTLSKSSTEDGRSSRVRKLPAADIELGQRDGTLVPESGVWKLNDDGRVYCCD